MAFVYDAGLRIRPPEPMPACVEGETAQDYFARVLAQCQLESATSAENASGDSAPTPFNLGQVQQDVERNTADIDALETEVNGLQSEVEGLTGNIVAGSVSYGLGATASGGSLPSEGTWKVFITPVGQALADLFVTASATSFAVTFGATAAAGSYNYLAVKA